MKTINTLNDILDLHNPLMNGVLQDLRKKSYTPPYISSDYQRIIRNSLLNLQEFHFIFGYNNIIIRKNTMKTYNEHRQYVIDINAITEHESKTRFRILTPSIYG